MISLNESGNTNKELWMVLLRSIMYINLFIMKNFFDIREAIQREKQLKT